VGGRGAAAGRGVIGRRWYVPRGSVWWLRGSVRTCEAASHSLSISLSLSSLSLSLFEACSLPLTLGLLGLWDSGTLGLWDSGTLGLWGSGTLGLWGSGTLGLWDSLGLRDSGTLGLWTLGLWDSGTRGLGDSGTRSRTPNYPEAPPRHLPRSLSNDHRLYLYQ
jgi:hypothetical protein